MQSTLTTPYVLLFFFVSYTQTQPQIDDAVFEKLANFSCGDVWECPEKGAYSSCACDELCDIAGDCCQMSKIQHKPRFTITQIEDFECVTSSLADDGSEVLMITKCPKKWKDQRVRELCEDSVLDADGDDFQTVHVSGKSSGFMFKNQYCAMCHQEKFSFWQPTVGCNESFIFQNQPKQNISLPSLLKNRSDCKIVRLSPPVGSYSRTCVKRSSLVRKCPKSWNHAIIKDLCEKPKGIRPVYYIGQIIIKNIYCGFCGIPNLEKFVCPIDATVVRTVNIYPFSILFDINNLPSGVKETIVCSDNQVFDPFADICRDALCSQHMVFRNGKCVQTGNNDNHQNSPPGLDCPKIILDQYEFTISEDGRLIVLNSNYVYEPGFYDISEDKSQAVVCTNFTRNSTRSQLQYSFDDTQAIFSIIGISLSIIGCVLTISIYIGFKSLRNIPGKIVISLCIALIVAYLTMLIGPALRDSLNSCKTFAIFMHYAFLLAFFWMNVMAIDVWYTFSNAYHQAGAKGHSTNRFKYYMGYVFTMAAIPVILAIVMNEMEISEEFSPRYGEGMCWITSRNALMVFFGLPALIILMSNVILFVISARTIYVSQKNSAKLLGKEDKSMLGIYIRLTIVMGVAYLFGFLVPIINHEVIMYLFIILNTLQGVLIFISFVCTQKVLGLMREQANTWSQSRSDNSFSGSRSTTKSSALSFRSINEKL